MTAFSTWIWIQEVRYIFLTYTSFQFVVSWESPDEEDLGKELDCEKKTSYVIWCVSENAINPLPGYV
jgi:hypothetical protein